MADDKLIVSHFLCDSKPLAQPVLHAAAGASHWLSTGWGARHPSQG